MNILTENKNGEILISCYKSVVNGGFRIIGFKDTLNGYTLMGYSFYTTVYGLDGRIAGGNEIHNSSYETDPLNFDYHCNIAKQKALKRNVSAKIVKIKLISNN